MAYVMNPYSYKLGYSLSWSDNWFSNKKLYPVMLQIMLTIRYFLIFFWTSRNMEQLDTYLSHLNLTLNSGKLLITLFFYEAKFNQPVKLKYKILRHIIHSIPYSDRNAEFNVAWRVKNQSVNRRALGTTSAVKAYFFYENTLLETYESQRFFLFFYFLGLDPASFLLEFYSRYGEREFGIGSNKKILKHVIANKRFRISGKRYGPNIFIYQLEYIFLNRIYKFLNEKVFFFWLYDKEKNLNMVRFLRTLFFYGGMAYFGKYYAPLIRSPGVFFSSFPEINNLRKNKKMSKIKKITSNLTIIKKKKKNYNPFLQKLQVICYFSLLNLNYKQILSDFKKKYNKHNLYNFLKYTLLNINIRDQKKKNFFFSIKKLPLDRTSDTYKFWRACSLKRYQKIKDVFGYRKEKMKWIEKYYSIFVSQGYLFSQYGSTKFDSFGNFFLNNKLKPYEFLIDSYGFTRDFKGRKLNIKYLTRFYYYRIFFNMYGNFVWFINGKELSFLINLPRNISRYIFLNDFYKKLYRNYITDTLKKFINFKKLNKKLNIIYFNYHKLNDYVVLQKLYYDAIDDFLYFKRSVFWKLFLNFWDFKKLYPKIVNKISEVIVNYKSYSPSQQKKLVLLENFIHWEPASWKILDATRAIYTNLIKMRYLLKKYELVLNRYLKYKKNFFNYKLGFLKKLNLYNTNKYKNILLWKSKYWYKFRTYKDSKQFKGEFVIFNRYFHKFHKKQNRTFLFLYNEGIFRILEQNSVYINKWFPDKFKYNKKLYIQKNNLKDLSISKDFFYIKKKKLSYLRKNYCFTPKVNNLLQNILNVVKFFEKKKYYLDNKKNYNLFLKHNKLKNTMFLKKNYKFLLKYNILKKNNFLKFKKKLIILNNNVNYLKKLNKKKRETILKKFFKKWLLIAGKPEESMLDDYFWYYFVFKARPKTFKWKYFKVFLRKKEKVNWKKLYIFLKYRTLNSSFDYKSIRKKIQSQEFSKKKTNWLLKKFSSIFPYRKKMLKKQEKYPRYGLKLYKYFKNYGRTAPLFKQKVLKRFSQQNVNLHLVRFSYVRLFFIFWFLSLRQHRDVEPKELFLNKHYNRTNLYDFGSLLFIYLLKKPFFDFFSYYIRAVLKFWLNINIDFNYVIITNDELSAQFIANHIARALHYGYKWREVVKPIRRDLKNLLTSLRVLEKRSRNTFFTKYENYENYKNTLYEYSFIYIKLHIKNYITSFTYFVRLKKIRNYIKNCYPNYKFYRYFKFIEIPEVDEEDDPFEVAIKKEIHEKKKNQHIHKHNKNYDHGNKKNNKYGGIKKNKYNNNFSVNNKKKYNLNITYLDDKLSPENISIMKQIFKTNRDIAHMKNNNITDNNIQIINMLSTTMKRVNELWSFTEYFNFFFKLKYVYFFFSIKMQKKFVYIKLNFIMWLRNWKKNFLIYFTQLSNILFVNFYKNFMNKNFFNINVKNVLYKKKFIFLFFYKFIKKKLVYKMLFYFNKNIDSIYKYFYFNHNYNNIRNHFNNNILNFITSFNINIYNIYILFFDLINLKNLNLNFVKSYIFFILNILQIYNFYLNYYLNFNISYKKENFLKNLIVKNNFINFIKILNNFIFKIKLFNKKFILLLLPNFVNNKMNYLNLNKENLGYKSIDYKKPCGWIYSYYNNILFNFRFYFMKFLKIFFFKIINKYFKLPVILFKFISVLNNYYIYFSRNKLIKKILNYYNNLTINLKTKAIIFNKNFFKLKNYKFIYNNNFIFIYLNILLNNILNKKFIIFTQFKFMYEKLLIINKINHWIDLPHFKISVLLNFKKFDWNLIKIVERRSVLNRNYLSKYSFFIKKNTFIEHFYHNRFLVGYKFRFAGRFKRRRKRVIMWLTKGLTPVSAHDKWIDYGFHEIANEHSQYSVRLWLNKNKTVKYKHYIKF